MRDTWKHTLQVTAVTAVILIVVVILIALSGQIFQPRYLLSPGMPQIVGTPVLVTPGHKP